IVVVVAVSTLTALLFAGTLKDTVPLTLVSDRAGLVMENGAKVKLRGVQIGEVSSVGADSNAGVDLSRLSLKMDPVPFQYLANNVLLAVNPRMPTVQQDWQLFGKTAEAYSGAAQDILSVLDSFSTTSATITTHAKSLDQLLLSAVGFSQSGINTIGPNQPNLVRAMNILDPTTALLMKYSPTYTCLFQGAQWFLD